MEPRGFDSSAPNRILALKYVKENEGCTIGELRQHLGIRSSPLPISPIQIFMPQTANRIAVESAIKDLTKLLEMNEIIKTDQITKSFLGRQYTNPSFMDSSHLCITAKGEEALNISIQIYVQQKIFPVLWFIHEKGVCSIKDIDIFEKQFCSKARAFDADFGNVQFRQTVEWLVDSDHSFYFIIVARKLLEIDGSILKGKSMVKLTEMGLLAMESEPDDVLRLLYEADSITGESVVPACLYDANKSLDENLEMLMDILLTGKPRNWYRRPTIPPQKLSDAIAKYAADIKADEVIGFADSGSKHGWIFTAHGMYYRTRSEQGQVSWKEIQKAVAMGGFPTYWLELTLHDGSKIRIACSVFQHLRPALEQLINQIVMFIKDVPS